MSRKVDSCAMLLMIARTEQHGLLLFGSMLIRGYGSCWSPIACPQYLVYLHGQNDLIYSPSGWWKHGYLLYICLSCVHYNSNVITEILPIFFFWANIAFIYHLIVYCTPVQNLLVYYWLTSLLETLAFGICRKLRWVNILNPQKWKLVIDLNAFSFWVAWVGQILVQTVLKNVEVCLVMLFQLRRGIKPIRV